ncbi:MAG: DNA-deoxyinosine glycosylase [Methanomassiliicoccus sp.]|nr:DNA-deoxyinosine glycosylase [Methanomassiliicoccus sp.]
MPSVRSLPPVVDDGTRALVLGSMPGRRSLEEGRYYANPQNQFWKIVHHLYGREPAPSYRERLEFILERGIGLWDVLQECSRVGSLDSSIKGAIPNDLGAFLIRYPRVRWVFFNGAKARSAFDVRSVDPVRRSSLAFTLLPSTSSANAHMRLDEKILRWQEVRRCLDAGGTDDI